MERKDGSKTEKNKEGGGITMALLEVKNLAWIKKFFAKGKKEKEAADNVNA